MSTTTWPAARAARWAPRSVRPKKGSVTSRTTRPTADAVPERRARAAALGRWPSSRAAVPTASEVACEMRPEDLPEKTSDTVVCETPARRATSTLVTLRERGDTAPVTGRELREFAGMRASHHAGAAGCAQPELQLWRNT